MIGLYVHDGGPGHMCRALAVAREIDDDVTVLTTHPVPSGLLPANAQVVRLPPLLRGSDGAVLTDAPLHDPRLRARMSVLFSWIERAAPTVVWVDSSPETLLAIRLAGVPVLSSVLPGTRDDTALRMANTVADGLMAGWPVGTGGDSVLRTRREVTEVGGLSRFERRERRTRRRADRPRVVRVHGWSGRHDRRFWGAVRDRVTRDGRVDWTELGGPDHGWVDDPWEELSAADVVVSGAGQGSVADACCTSAPLVVVPERRPFGAQDATADALAELPGVTVRRYGSGPASVVEGVLDAVERSREDAGSALREAWGIDGACSRAAAAIDETTGEPGGARHN